MTDLGRGSSEVFLGRCHLPRKALGTNYIENYCEIEERGPVVMNNLVIKYGYTRDI